MGKLKRTLLSLMLAGAGALGGAKGLEGEIVEVKSIYDANIKAESFRNFYCENLRYQNEPLDKKAVFFIYREVKDTNDKTHYPCIGGLNNYPRVPWAGGGFINVDDAWHLPDDLHPEKYLVWGLNPGDILGNTREGANVSGGFFAGVDFSGDGIIGDYDTATARLTFEPGEYIPFYKIQLSGFSAFPTSGNGTIQSINIVPENSGVRNINFQTEPIDPMNTLQKSAFVSFSFIGDNIFQERPAGNYVLDAKIKISYLVDDGDNNSSNDIIVGSVDNHVIYSFPNQESIEHYRITDTTDPLYGEYEMPCFMFGGPEFSLGEQAGAGPFNLYAKVECLGQGDSQYIKFFPAYSDNHSVNKTPEPATLGLFGLGSLAAYLLRKRK